MRSRTASTTSTGETFLRRMRVASSFAERQQSSSDAIGLPPQWNGLTIVASRTPGTASHRNTWASFRCAATAGGTLTDRLLQSPPPATPGERDEAMTEPARTDYPEVYSRSLREPERFWAEAAEALHWERRWDRVLDDSRPPFYRWFRGGRLSTCYNALDVHVDRGRGRQ